MYKIYGTDEKFSTRDSLLIVSKEKVYLKIGNITETNDIKNINVDNVIIYDNDKNNILFSGDPKELLIESRKSIEKFNTLKLKKSYDSLYMKFNYQDEEYIIKLNTVKDFQNQSLFFKEEKLGTTSKTFDIKDIKLSKEFKYDKENDVYVLKKDNFEIKYFENNNFVRIYEFNNNYDYKYEYYFDFSMLRVGKCKNGKVINRLEINTNDSNDLNYYIYEDFKNKYLDSYFKEK